jgi:membrane protease YdiL (CAAX protease family)
MNFLEQSLDKQNQWWKYLVTIVVAFIAANFIGAIPMVVVVMVQLYKSGGIHSLNPQNMMDMSGLGIPHNLMLFLLMIPFVVLLIALILMIKTLHKRTFSQTVNGTQKVRWNRVFCGIIVWSILMVIYYVVDYLLFPKNYILQFDFPKFLILVFISLIFIPIQTTSEELMFRGYLAQGVAGWTKSRIWAIIIPGVIFGLTHFMNPEVKEYGFAAAMPSYIFFGLVFGLVAVLDDGIELSIGMHAVNNVFLSLFVTNKSSALLTDAVFEQLNINILKDNIILFAIGTIAIIYFSKKYKWDWNILTKEVSSHEE